MKVKMLSRNPDHYVRETKLDLQRVPRNYDPTLHPFEVPREYIRALNATKLERVFAKPFLASLDGHRDGVNCLAKNPKSLATVLSGACDGEVKIWNLTKRKCIRTIQAHEGFVRGICTRFCGTSFFTVGDDKTVKQWKMDGPSCGEEEEPLHTILGKTVYTGIDHHWREAVFATCGQQVDIWDEQRTSPICSMTWGFDSISSVKFNPIETFLLGSCASDRNIVLYDMRQATPLKKVILDMRTNTICWNPMEAFIFTAANEDYNLYTFDMRALDTPVMVHMDHVSAVLDVDYSPTGREFVSASFDKSIRIFPVDKSRSREVYHTKRMQHVICVKWTADSKYIMCGSDEMNIRLWKANASEKLGVLTSRERAATDYNQKLKEKFQHHPHIKRISRHRHLPKSIYSQIQEQRIMKEARRRKELNRIKHSKPGSVQMVSEKKKHVVAVVK
ncbi:DDB1- and CUL4-associated factor 13 isoform X1 [Bos indicus]|uniref:DDB1- and CUL4-associated factor 13 n=4 Tax=Bovinae TaxID=27592 RepID=F1MVI8_BOVIN|nr:PREDICTED: DDB1- and CUL4-associated factor 13 [Bison bison bison]XP_027417192.1 DDB1- and CUL4-associated factor 13 [Bos indicus x Bos taurus]XP_059730470.1 DDB1- and CUL4-associated factor 13 isoform X1 [Bos taurus]